MPHGQMLPSPSRALYLLPGAWEARVTGGLQSSHAALTAPSDVLPRSAD